VNKNIAGIQVIGKSHKLCLEGSSPSPASSLLGKIMRKINIDEVRAFIEAQSPETKIYIGCDSERHRVDGVWFADYITAIVVHIDGKHGCKLFGEVNRERDYDHKQNKPR
jgi:predicted RNase H-related nuclease YkuK (DUF458 family)